MHSSTFGVEPGGVVMNEQSMCHEPSSERSVTLPAACWSELSKILSLNPVEYLQDSVADREHATDQPFPFACYAGGERVAVVSGHGRVSVDL
jgi:hypothetical protein